jgi:hypothetical protein
MLLDLSSGMFSRMVSQSVRTYVLLADLWQIKKTGVGDSILWAAKAGLDSEAGCAGSSKDLDFSIIPSKHLQQVFCSPLGLKSID